ncbi:MAG TPA: response regulator transcription factor [Pyrinomonadaceae bacterium]|nr:response regulator transcription factor [Chloracidobacterium sp.]MBP9934529.1 response regulator transcription factor [Pyrinomonadaceae bacterium]MBK7802470.1 response regulator transcription factor [Chloracidobacterium sp.]MBK9437339.1 response regulator transcription factor [Chloracidobacterium sp.]MBK9766067.1 response regulator transcription factor [Chloracidobacterium sp.]
MSENKKILIVDDESQITRVLRHSLTAHRYDVRTAADGVSALETFHDWHPDLIITDLQMPEMDGIGLCREIRKVSTLPVIVLSVRGEEKTKVQALDAGADDYITKPFGIEELLARVRASLRRNTTSVDDELATLNDGDFSIDVAMHNVNVREAEIHLTPKEFDLLVFLFRNRDKVITHRAILAAIWGGNFTEQTEYLRVFVGQLRKKIEVDPSQPKYITTEPWVGYRFLTSSHNRQR